MILDIGITDVKKSNEFLRSLWAEMAKEFGKCGWQYIPYKNKQTKTITFGFMDIGVSILIAGVTYKNNGSIIKLFFEYSDASYDYEYIEGQEDKLIKESELGKRLIRVVRKARRGMRKYNDYYALPTIKSLLPLSNYEGNNFKTEYVGENKTRIYFPVSAYDENQVEGKITQKINQVIDFLSVETNAPFWNVPTTSRENKEKTVLTKEVYQELDFIDGFSVKDGYLTISEEAKDFLSYLIDSNGENEDLQTFLNACYHFHTARKYDAQIHDYQGYFDRPLEDGSGVGIEIYTKNQDLRTALVTGGAQTEIATTLYMSALEVVTLIGFQSEKCKACNQDKYSIASRVRNLVNKQLNSHIAKQLNDYYDKRSRYLHRGYMLTNDEPTTSLIPLLDIDGENGCNFPVQVSLINLREYTSYILRAFYKEYFLNKENIKE
ncbi:hypothetical protein [Bacillus wiedmannii]|uniref:hypothetical protein n=1 Tax=Bacillus wiedmannii TaxID=1890302 RepID=UPI0006D987BF|nr:hypothetical protein [Bacillus wiedmannii]KPU51462.1 hypothetical protein AN402_319 [Bacillus wiedmannii]